MVVTYQEAIQKAAAMATAASSNCGYNAKAAQAQALTSLAWSQLAVLLKPEDAK